MVKPHPLISSIPPNVSLCYTDVLTVIFTAEPYCSTALVSRKASQLRLLRRFSSSSACPSPGRKSRLFRHLMASVYSPIQNPVPFRTGLDPRTDVLASSQLFMIVPQPKTPLPEALASSKIVSAWCEVDMDCWSGS